MERGSFLLSFLFSFSKKNFDSRKLIFLIPNFILKNIHNVDKSINQSIKKTTTTTTTTATATAKKVWYQECEIAAKTYFIQ